MFWFVVVSVLVVWLVVKVMKSNAAQIAAAKAKEEAEKAKEEAEKKRQAAEQEVDRQAHERRKLELEAAARRRILRDADSQDEPYTYEIDTHGNESLAIRYGIANNERKVEEYWYHAQGGQYTHNPARNKVYFKPASFIRLQKVRRVGTDHFDVLLTDFQNRLARAVIEAGTEYVKTFYPLDDGWFRRHAELELTLKGNGSFTLKELAKFHVQKAVRN